MADQKLKKSAEELRSKGRGGDTILAHINPQEAAILKMMGGAGTKNPDTGLPEFLRIQADEDRPPPGTPGVLAGTVYANDAPDPNANKGFFGQLAKVDPSAAISRELTNLTSPVVDPIKKAVSTGLADVDKNLSLSKNAPVIASIALAFAVPAIGSQIGASLMQAGVVTSAASASATALAAGATAAQAAAAAAAATATATAIGTAIASATYQVAQGVPVTQAVQNSIIAATVGSQAPGVAKQVNDIVGSPEVTNLIVSTGASAVQTAASGGSESDIVRNATGALVGSGVTSATDSNIAGRAAGGGVTGGVVGALTGAAGAAGATANLRNEAAQVEQEQDAPSILPPAKPAVVSTAEQDIRNLMANISPGIQTADLSGGIIAMPKGVRDETAEKLGINLPQIDSTMTVVDPETKGTLPTVSVVAPRDEQITFQEGQPDLPELNKAGEGLVIVGDKTPTGGGSSVLPADQKILDLIKPTPTAGSVAAPITGPTAGPGALTPQTFSPPNAQETDAERVARIDAETARVLAGEADYTARSRPGTGTGGGNVVVGPGTDAGAGNATGNVVISDGGLGGGGGNAAGNVVVGPGDGGGGPGGNVTIDAGGGGGGGNATSNVSENVVVDEPPDEEDKPPEEEDKPPGEKEDKFKPDLFIYGGKRPPRRPRPELRTTLQGPFAPSTTLGQALTGYRGAGEIEGKKTGKPRKNVWNEESLRLKDALGL
jgi:hypothetical protein